MEEVYAKVKTVGLTWRIGIAIMVAALARNPIPIAIQVYSHMDGSVSVWEIKRPMDVHLENTGTKLLHKQGKTYSFWQSRYDHAIMTATPSLIQYRDTAPYFWQVSRYSAYP